MIILRGYILVPETDLLAVQNALPVHKALTLAEPGCLTFQVEPCTVNPLRFDVYEAFSDRAAFDAHQHRAKASSWGSITAQVERHYRIEEKPLPD